MTQPSTTGRAAPVGLRPIRGFIACVIASTAFAVVCGLAMPRTAAAANGSAPPIVHLTGASQTLEPDLRLLCPRPGSTAPQFENVTTGKVFAIYDPKLLAIADRVCHPRLAVPQAGNVNILNDTGKLLLVGFAPQAGAQITWGAGCGAPIKGTSVVIRINGGCRATVTDSVASPGSRFCAAIAQVASSASAAALDCSKAQQQNRTLVETYFQPGPCFGPGTSNCIWYDISVIPSTCTDQAWAANHCANNGGAAYNLPVTLSCFGEPTYVCRGPAGNKYGPARYPSNCGNPAAKPVSGPTPDPTALNAYFYPDDNSSGQPNAVCPNGKTLTIAFLPGA